MQKTIGILPKVFPAEFMRTMTHLHGRYASEFCFYGFQKEFVILTGEYRKHSSNFVAWKYYEILWNIFSDGGIAEKYFSRLRIVKLSNVSFSKLSFRSHQILFATLWYSKRKNYHVILQKKHAIQI